MADASTSSQGKTRKKAKDYTYQEEIAIAQFYVDNRKIFDSEIKGLSASTKAITIAKKNDLYQKMTDNVNAIGHFDRPEHSVRNKLRDLKSSARRKTQNNMKGTGGGAVIELSVGEEIIIDSEIETGSKLTSGLSTAHEVGLRRQSPRLKQATHTVAHNPDNDNESQNLFDEDVDTELEHLIENIHSDEAEQAAQAISNFEDNQEDRQKSVTDTENTPSDMTCSPVFTAEVARTKQFTTKPIPSSKTATSMDLSTSYSLLQPSFKRKTSRNAPARHGLVNFKPTCTSSPTPTIGDGSCASSKVGPNSTIVNKSPAAKTKALTDLEKAHLEYFQSAKDKNIEQKAYLQEMSKYYKLKRKYLKKQIRLNKIQRMHYSTKRHATNADLTLRQNRAKEESVMATLNNKKVKLESRKLQLYILSMNPDETFDDIEDEVPNDTDIKDELQSQQSDDLSSDDDSKGDEVSSGDSSDFESDANASERTQAILQESVAKTPPRKRRNMGHCPLKNKEPAEPSTSKSVEKESSQSQHKIVHVSGQKLCHLDSEIVELNKSSYTQNEEDMTPKEYAKHIICKENLDHNPLIKAAFDYFDDLAEFLKTNMKSIYKKYPILVSYTEQCKSKSNHYDEVKRFIGYNTGHTDQFVQYVLQIHRRLFAGKMILKGGNKMSAALSFIIALKYSDLFSRAYPDRLV